MIDLTLATLLMIASPEDVKKADPELYCLAENIYHEARGESYEGQLAVANVTLNRVDSKRFPDSICGVTKQSFWVIRGGKKIRPQKYRCQFSWFCDGKPDTIGNYKSWREVYKVAVDAVYGTVEDNTGGATFYHADYVSPGWAKLFKKTVKIGTHIFYKR